MHLTLAELPKGEACVVLGLELEPREAAWLRAVGLFEGTELTVLRRAPFGGPLHLRTSSGGEFAVDRGLAGSIYVARATPTTDAARDSAASDGKRGRAG